MLNICARISNYGTVRAALALTPNQKDDYHQRKTSLVNQTLVKVELLNLFERWAIKFYMHGLTLSSLSSEK